jgi:uncharacterized repeat protein (TIGR01451 family)
MSMDESRTANLAPVCNRSQKGNMKYFKSISITLLVLGAVFAGGAQARAEVVSQLVGVKVVVAADGKEAVESADTVQPGDVIEYRVDYRNKGDDPARALEVTLPIPLGLEFVLSSARPGEVSASLDGKVYQAVPLKRRVKGADGRELEQLVPVAEYRSLRWNAVALGAGKSKRYTARMRVNSATAALASPLAGAAAR